MLILNVHPVRHQTMNLYGIDRRILGWLEPLLYEIKKDRTNVICPIIDVISDDTFEFLTGSDLTYGGFNWKLNFR